MHKVIRVFWDKLILLIVCSCYRLMFTDSWLGYLVETGFVPLISGVAYSQLLHFGFECYFKSVEAFLLLPLF